MKYAAFLLGLIPLAQMIAARPVEGVTSESISIVRLDPSHVDHSSQKIIIPRSAIKGDSVWVSVIGGVREPGIYFMEKGAAISDLLQKVSYYPGATRTGLLVINNEAGTRVEFRVGESADRELEISISHWLLKDGDVVFVLETVK